MIVYYRRRRDSRHTAVSTVPPGGSSRWRT